MRIDAMRDSDSLLKPLFDGLEYDPKLRIGVIKNDRQIAGYSVIKSVHKKGYRDLISVTAFEWDEENAQNTINRMVDFMDSAT